VKQLLHAIRISFMYTAHLACIEMKHALVFHLVQSSDRNYIDKVDLTASAFPDILSLLCGRKRKGSSIIVNFPTG
jgi:hypothetical protein